MAKAKKQEPAASEAAKPAASGKGKSAPAAKAAANSPAAAKAAPKPAAAGAAAAKPAAKKPAAKPAPKPAAPLIDTSLAAEAAATMVMNKGMLGGAAAPGPAGSKPESSTFRQLKESLNRPASQGTASLLQNTAPQKKSNVPFGGFKQVGRNQTFGADVNRAGVPRRTGG